MGTFIFLACKKWFWKLFENFFYKFKVFIFSPKFTKLNAKVYSAGKLHFLNARNDTCSTLFHALECQNIGLSATLSIDYVTTLVAKLQRQET